MIASLRFLGLLALLLVAAGCATVPDATGPAGYGPRGDTVAIAPGVEGVEVLALREALAPDGTRRINLTLRSISVSRQTLRYRAIWFDDRGMEVRTSLSNWTRRVIDAGQSFEAVFVGPGPTARGLRIEIEKSPN